MKTLLTSYIFLSNNKYILEETLIYFIFSKVI
uniref:Uncharacterized protein n=1 Tax=viral metagenome TaxID=1070528 RepID=A0A6C0H7N7_9ZZZZ